MIKGYILALDQSTSGSKAMIIDKYGHILAKASLEHRQFYKKPGWVEHDPIEIYEKVRLVLNEVLDKAHLGARDMDVLSITNQRETILVWDKDTGKPIYNAIVWQCRRTSDLCQRLKEEGYEDMIKEKTGLLIDPYFPSTKVKWILDNVKGAREKANNGKLLLGTIDSWLVWNLTGGRTHVTDYSNASRTQLFNIRSLGWDTELLELFEIPSNMLPKIESSNWVVAHTDRGEIFDASIPIAGLIGDSQGALFGQNCFDVGMIKATYGTGSSILMYLGDQFIEAGSGLVTSLAWGIDGKVDYVLEGIVHSTGDTLKWVKDNLGLFHDYEDARKMAASLDSNEGVYLVPAFVGLGIPYWDPDARAALVGMSRGSRREHIVRAAIESAAYQVMDAVNTMVSGSGIQPKELRADGGASRDTFLMQFQADMLDLKVVCTQNPELSALGSAYLAGLAVGLWKDKDEIKNLREEVHVYKPSIQDKTRARYHREWKTAVDRVLT